MKKIDYFFCSLVSLLALLSRAPLVEKFQSHWDGPQYSIAVIRFSYQQLTPTPPGYPLYIATGKLFYPFLHDPHNAILAASVFGGILSSAILYVVGKKMYNLSVGLAASIIFLTGSTFYYFGLTPYGFEELLGFEILLAYCVYRIYVKKKYEGLLFGIVLGIWFGIRPQELLQMFPIVGLGLYFLPKKEKIKSLSVFFLITLLWLVPIVYSTGLQKFITLWYNDLLISVVNNSLSTRVELIIKGFLLSFGISSVFLFYYIWKYVKNKKILKKVNNEIIFYAVWILPGLLYNLVLRTEHAGYQMSYLSAFLLLIGYALWAMTKKKRILYIALLAVVAVFNLFWFFYNRDPNYTKPYRPTSFHYSDIRKNDLKMGSKVKFVLKKFNPKKTYVITTDVLWRPYSYYLKDYYLTSLFGLDNIEAPYIYNQIDTINWNINWHQNNKFVIVVPSNASTVVFMDDPAATWIKNYPFKTYHLPGNSTIASITVKPKSKIVYGYHSIKVDTK